MRGAIPPLPQYVFMAWRSIKQGYVFMVWYLVKHRDKVNFTFIHVPKHCATKGCDDRTPLVFNLGVLWRSVVSLALRLLYPYESVV